MIVEEVFDIPENENGAQKQFEIKFHILKFSEIYSDSEYGEKYLNLHAKF